MSKKFDYIIIGAGIYGAYISKKLLESGKSIALIECDPEAFSRASYINQARVHNGYHYPRSFSTAIKSANYFKRFNEEFHFAINNAFKKIYATSSAYSMTSGEQFKNFCKYADIPCKEIKGESIFNEGLVDGVFETLEYSFDAKRIRDYLMFWIKDSNKSELFFGEFFSEVEIIGDTYEITFPSGKKVKGDNVINCTYASTNQILKKFGFEQFDIKYELAELTLCKTKGLNGYGITLMDGPFFSLMPFGLGDTYSLTSVSHTPRKTCFENFPIFDCQKKNVACTKDNLQNCNTCVAKPNTAFDYMHQMAKKYLKDNVEIKYEKSLFAIKPILKVSEMDDSRPTIVKTFRESPGFTTVFSGKINTMYDLDIILDNVLSNEK